MMAVMKRFRTVRGLAWVCALLLPLTVLAQDGGFPPAAVVVEKVRRTEIAPTISIPGTVLSRFDSRLASEVEGRVIWFADVGTVVAEGDPLVKLESTTLEIQREEYRGLVERERARLTFLEPEVIRLETLRAQNNAAESLLNQTQSDLEVARGDLDVANARLRQVEDQIDKTTIPAPFDGIVSERLVNLGEMISRLDVVVRLVSPETIEITSRAPLNAVAFLEPESEVAIYNEYRRGTGTVRTIVPFGDPQSHMFELRVDVPAGSWIVGESVRLDVPTAQPKQALAVPRDALILRREGTFVFRVNAEQVAERVPVTTGAGDGPLIEVEGDLAPDDLVIIRGGERLFEGQTVMVTDG
jgi:RND family efflux transporter MFP subunit